MSELTWSEVKQAWHEPAQALELWQVIQAADKEINRLKDIIEQQNATTANAVDTFEKEIQRLLEAFIRTSILAIKHCPIKHPDMQELKQIVKSYDDFLSDQIALKQATE